VNVSELAERLEMEEGEFLELTDIFLEKSLSDLKDLRSAIGTGDSGEATRNAHSIKGASVNLGFMEVFEAAKGTEMDARENRLDALAGSVDSILEKLDRISEYRWAREFGSSASR
jgi:HPt (histidine-containing phosphotransfer) domain-containing protein